MAKDRGNNLRKREDLQKLTMCIAPLVKIIMFSYLPMLGLVLAFQNFKPEYFLFSSFVGFENFRIIFSNAEQLFRLIFNAVILNVMFIVFNTVATIVLALFMYELTKKATIRLVQTFLLFPFFVAWPVVGQLVMSIIGMNGALTSFIAIVNGGRYIDFYSQPQYWRWFFMLIFVWKSAGFGAIINYCMLLTADKETYEAADIDGASRFQKMRYISFSNMSMMIAIGLISSIGNIMRVDFSMIYFVVGNNSALYPAIDVIETYMYRALSSANMYGQTVATGLFQGVVGLVLTVGANWISRRINKDIALY